MDSESWLEKAERLRSVLDELNAVTGLKPDEAAAREIVTIALWLRNEFAESPNFDETAAVPFLQR